MVADLINRTRALKSVIHDLLPYVVVDEFDDNLSTYYCSGKPSCRPSIQICEFRPDHDDENCEVCRSQ